MADSVSFAGFPRETFRWFAGLEADNSKSYFATRRETYERAVRGSLEALLEELAEELGGSVTLFRQNRDLRFSADKSPYKTRTYGVIAERPDSLARLYAELSAAGLVAGTGYHVLAPDQLARFRKAVVDDRTGSALERAIASAESSGVETLGEALTTAPRGYARDHPRARLLRHRSLVAVRRLEPGATGIGRDAALDHARGTWGACAPLSAWLDRYVGSSMEQPKR